MTHSKKQRKMTETIPTECQTSYAKILKTIVSSMLKDQETWIKTKINKKK